MDNSAPVNINKKVQAISGEAQLRLFGTFLDEHIKLLDYLNADDNERNYHRQTGKPDPVQCAPVTIDYDMRHEEISIFQLVDTNNKVLNKIVCVFTHICIEAKRLRDQAEEYQLQFMYADETLMAGGTEFSQQSLIVKISEQLDFLCNIQYLVQRCLIVSVDTFKQLAAFFSDSRYISNNNTTTSIQLQSVFGYLADLATVFVTFDRILKKSNIHENWSLFLKSINSLYDNLGQFGDTYVETDVSGLRNVLNEMEVLFNGDLFQMFMDGLYSVKLSFDAKTSTAFAYHFSAYIKTQFYKIDKYAPLVLNDFSESREVIKCNVMCVVNHNVFGKVEQSTFSRLFEVNAKYCGITLLEHILWHPETFVGQYVVHAPKSAGQKAQSKYIADATRVRQDYLRTKFSDYRVTCFAQKLCLRVFVWTMKIRQAHQSERVDVTVENLNYRCSLILDGIQLMGEICFLVKLVTNLHIHLNTPMSKPTLANVCRLLEHFKIIKLIYNDYMDFFIDSLYIVCQHMSYQALSIIQLTMKKFTTRTTSTSYNERDIDILSALQLSEKCMFGPSTALRILTTRLTLSISDPMKVFSVEHLDKLSKVLSNIEALIELRGTINKCPDTTFMYWHQSILPNYLKQVLAPSGDSAKFWNIFHSPKSSVHFLAKVNAISPTMENTDFNIDTNHLLRTAVLSRICSHIENNLRLFIHSYMHDSNATAPSAVDNDTTALIHMNSLRLNDCHFLFKNHIEHYLTKTFYNLTAVSLSDGRTYGEMRSFAKIKYDLNVIEDQLPTETLEQGLDLLDIMRFINDFATKFVYDMNNQVFIQAKSNINFLNTVTVGHIVNSLRTHGIGIMNTAINCSYKLLCQKMPLISKFLYTDKVKSGLSKNLKHFQDNKERMNQMYSYELAKNFAKNMQKSSSELSFVEFLDIITHIGNIMGYVRLIRSAGIKYVSNASIFLPSVTAIRATTGENPEKVEGPSIADMATDLNLSDVTCEAAWNLNINIINLSKDFVIKPDYFRSFLQAFTEIIRDPKNMHLKYFYISIPSLTMLFIDAIIRSKENKHKNAGANDRHVFTDDGFAMGLAYILIILNQVDVFYALDWFESIRVKYAQEMADIQKKLVQLTSSYEDEKLRQTLLLTVKRIQTFADEFEMLRCNLGSAIRYFQ